MDGCRRNPDVIARQGSAALPQLDEYLAIDASDIAIDIQRFNSRMLQKQRGDATYAVNGQQSNNGGWGAEWPMGALPSGTLGG